MAGKWLILFDGYCRLCQGSARFIARRDHDDCFRFATLQSAVGHQHRESGPEREADSLVLIGPDGRRFEQSTAWVEILRRLPAPWRWLGWLRWVPRALRDPVYRFVGRRRYRWFGKRDGCGIPDAAVRDRTLEDGGRDEEKDE